MPERTPGHLKTFGYIGLSRYALTFCCHNKQRRFERADAVDLVLSQIRRAANDERFVVSAYCFMPNHLHLLVKALADTSDALTFIKRAKQFSGFYYKQKYHVPLWQRYSYEHVLRDDDDLRRAAKYIFEIRYPFCERNTRIRCNFQPAANVRQAANVRLKPDATNVGAAATGIAEGDRIIVLPSLYSTQTRRFRSDRFSIAPARRRRRPDPPD